MNKYLKYIGIICIAFFICFLSSCNSCAACAACSAASCLACDGCSCNKNDDGDYTYVKNVEVKVLGGSTKVSLLKDNNDNSYALVTENQNGTVISNAIAVLKNGTRKVIDNINDFLLDNNVKSIEVNVEDGVNIESFSITPKTYDGYYLGQNYTIQLTKHIEPSNATNQYVRFYTSNSDIATVDRNGLVTVKSSGGVTITALTLDGCFKSTCMLQIKDGTVKLKDTMAYADFTTSSLTGNRYDEESAMESVFNSIAYSNDTSNVIVGGYAVYDNNCTFGIIAYGMPENEGDSFVGRYQIDQENLYLNDYVQDIIYHSYNHTYYVLSHVSQSGYSTDGNLLNAKMYISTFKEKYDKSMERYRLDKDSDKDSNKVLDTSNIYSKMFVVEDLIYCIGVNPKKECVIDQYDASFKYISTQTYDNIKSITEGYYDENTKKIVAVGSTKNDASAIIVIDTINKKNYFGYSSVISNAELCGISIIDDNHYVVCGNGTINSQNIGFVELFVQDEESNCITSINNIKLETSNMGLTSLTGINYANGVISVTGYETENMSQEVGCGNIKKYDESEYSINCAGCFKYTATEYFCCGTVISLNLNFKFLNAIKYFNSQDNTGKIQYFIKSLLLPNGNLICVGASNYKLKGDNYNGYIQFNVAITE